MVETNPQTLALVRMAVARVASDPEDEQRYLELNWALDRAVERDFRYRELLAIFEEGAATAAEDVSWAWWLAAGLGGNLTGDSERATHLLEQARRELEAQGRDHTAIGSFTCGELARAYYHCGGAPAEEAATRGLQLARSANSPLAEGYAHHYLGLILVRRREYDYARRHILAARELFERMKQRHGRARVLDSLASLEMDLGHYEVARQLLEESLGVKSEFRDLRGQALTCSNLGRLYTGLADYSQALHYLDRARELSTRVGDERTATLLRIRLGELHLRHNHAELARVELEAAFRMARDRHDEMLVATACFALAEAERRLGHYPDALHSIRLAERFFGKSDDVVMRDRVALRRALLEGVDFESSRVEGPLNRLRACDASGALADALFEAASFFHERGRVQQVAALYAEALDAAEPAQAIQLAEQMRSRAESVEGRAWVDAMLNVKHHKDELEQAYGELRRAESLRDALTQMIVHDLKNPLTAITPWLQTIQMGGLSEDETESVLQTVIDECDYLLRTIEDLNDVGKMQHERTLDLSLERLDLTELMNEVARRLQTRARDAGMTIRCDCPRASLLPVRGDRSKLRRVLENLVANAIKYGRPAEGSGLPAEVEIRARVEPPPPDGGSPSVRVEVCDFGPGIPLAEAERVFEPYYQAEAGRKRKAGVGLGLAFSRMVVQAHGGALWTEPNPHGGSVFAFRLPAEDLSS
ncbi:MAG: ATP-binding protein [Armatimonadota bacterium]